MTNDEVIDFLSNLSVLEISKLVKALEEKWGVSAAAPVAAAAAPVAAAAAVEEKTEFDVILTDFGANKIGVIKNLEIFSLHQLIKFYELHPKTNIRFVVSVGSHRIIVSHSRELIEIFSGDVFQ